MRALLRLSRLGLCCLTAASCAPASVPEPGRTARSANAAPANAADRAAIIRARDAFFAAFERGDAAALAALTTEDARLYAPGQPDLVGRAALDAVGRQMFATVRFADLRAQETEIDICGDVAYELTLYTQTVHPSTGSPFPVRGRALRVWRREADGVWRMSRNLYNWEQPDGG